MSRTWSALLAGLLLGIAAGLPARADDLDIYTNPTVLPTQAPLTALALDLNLTNPNSLVCDNVLLSTSAACVDIRAKVTLNDLLGLLGLPVSLLNGLDPLSLLGDLSSGVRVILSTTISLVSSLSLSQQQIYVLGLRQILEALIDSRVTIFLNHANEGPGNGPCAFADASSLGGQRQDTLACSNGAYVFAGISNLANPLELAALLTKLTSGLTTSSILGATGLLNFADSPFQAKEIYLELAKYLRGDPIYNGHLGYFDYGDNNPTTNLDSSLPLLSWDPGVEKPGNREYQPALAEFDQACTINLVHVQLTNATQQDESDAELQRLFPFADANGDDNLSLGELVESAATDGFVYGPGDNRLINSYFVVQDNLSDLENLTSLGLNVTDYSNVLGLLGRGQSIAGSLVKSLSVDTSISSLSVAASRSSATGITDAAYLPLFRPDPQQRPDWPGNLKRLRLVSESGDPLELRDANGRAAIASDGRIRTTALSLWTDPSALDGRSADGRKTDLGGAGQQIPGYQLGGGGAPGRGNPVGDASGRRLFYDSYDLFEDGASLVALNPDDAAVRSDLLADTGAAAYTPPTNVCGLACEAAFASCGLLCGTTQATANTLCATSALTCTTLCTTVATACNLLCLPGVLGNACRTSCSNSQTSCNNSCSNTQTSCLNTAASAFGSCSASCSSNRSSCLSACGSGGRTADTVARELLLHARGYAVGTLAEPAGTGPASSPTNSGIAGRPWLMGALLHSRPLAINYGPREGGAEDIRVVFGSADGTLRMVDDRDGRESWGFMPRRLMRQLPVLRENQAGAALPYGVDGSPVSLIRDRAPSGGENAGRLGVIGDSDEDRVLLFFGLRRGGSAYYALDVTDPDAPALRWSISPDGLRRAGSEGVVTGSASDYAALGLAFSTPQLARLRIDADGDPASTDDIETRSVLVFGGGYNGGRNSAGNKLGKDLNNSRHAIASEQIGKDDGGAGGDRGNALFLVDAETGALIWRGQRAASAGSTAGGRGFGHPLLVDGVAADVTVLDTNSDGLSDRIYFGDTGGRLWRADLPGSDRSAWTLVPLASVGRHSATTPSLASDRRIFQAPDYVPIRYRDQVYDIVLFGTGDREDPLNLVTENWFYAYRDTDVISGKTSAQVAASDTEAELAGARHSAFRDQSSSCASGAGSECRDVALLDPGYRLALSRRGEKLFSVPLSVGGATSFSSYVPPDPASPDAAICVPQEGAGRLYNLALRNSAPLPYLNQLGEARDSALPAPGLPGELSAVTRSTQAAGNKLIEQKVPPSLRASWRERLGEDEKPLP